MSALAVLGLRLGAPSASASRFGLSCRQLGARRLLRLFDLERRMPATVGSAAIRPSSELRALTASSSSLPNPRTEPPSCELETAEPRAAELLLAPQFFDDGLERFDHFVLVDA